MRLYRLALSDPNFTGPEWHKRGFPEWTFVKIRLENRLWLARLLYQMPNNKHLSTDTFKRPTIIKYGIKVVEIETRETELFLYES